MDTPPESTSWLVQFGIAALGAIGLILANMFKGWKTPEPPIRQTIETAEITDTKALSRRILDDIIPKLEQVLSTSGRVVEEGRERDHKIDEVLERLRRQEVREETAKLVREQVAEELKGRNRETDRDRHPRT